MIKRIKNEFNELSPEDITNITKQTVVISTIVIMSILGIIFLNWILYDFGGLLGVIRTVTDLSPE